MRLLPVHNYSAKIDGNVRGTSRRRKYEAALAAKSRLRCYSGRQWQEDTRSFSSCPPTLPRMLPSSSPSAFVILFSLLHQCGTSQIHSAVSFLFSPRSLFSPPPLFPSHPSSPLPPVPPSLPPVCLPSSPGLQTVQRLIYILLVEARHVRVHVPVVVADVALCAPVGHRSEAERWREFVGLLELQWGGEKTEVSVREVVINMCKAASCIK